MTVTLRTAFVLAATLFASQLHAQTRPSTTLLPPDGWRWDLAAHLGWLGSVTTVDPDRNGWYHVASLGVSGGYYWTPYIKTELGLSTNTEGEDYSYETFLVAGDPAPYYRRREHLFHSTVLSGSVVYQFFENRWVHPFVAAGFDLGREKEEVEASTLIPPPRNPIAAAQITTVPASTLVRYVGRPFIESGLKAYLSERSFVRSDLHLGISSKGVRSVVWRGGVGWDF